MSFAGGTGLSVSAGGESAATTVRAGFLLSGLGWGFMEASVNPLTAALYPEGTIPAARAAATAASIRARARSSG